LQLPELEDEGNTDRRNREDESRRFGEPPDEDELHDRAQRQRQCQPGKEGGIEPPLPGRDHRDGQDVGHRAHVALGKVDDAVGPVDEHDAHRSQGGQ
jgi:hypothetical protein